MAIPVKVGGEFLVNTTITDNQFDSALTALTDGRFVVTWEDASDLLVGDGAGTEIMAQMFNADGSRSGSEFRVNTTVQGNEHAPAITALTNGKYVVTWWDYSVTGLDTMFAATRAQVFNSDGTRSGDEFLVNTTIWDDQFDPAVTSLADGRFVIVWTDNSRQGGDISSDSIRAQIYNADGTRSGVEFVMNTTTENAQLDASVTCLTNGRFVAVWSDLGETGGDTSSAAIRARIFNADGTAASTEFLVNSTVDLSQHSPTIAALTDGRFVVAWTDNSASIGDTSGSAIRAQVFNANGTTSGSEFVVNTTDAGNQFLPAIASLSAGRFVVTWADPSQTGGDTSGYAIRAQVFNADGTHLGSEFLVNTIVSGAQSAPTVTALSGNRFVIAWDDASGIGGDTSGTGVHAQIFAVPSAPVMETADQIFAAEGKLTFLSQLALAAYHLGDWEKPLHLVNDINPRAEEAFNGTPLGPVQDGIRYTAVDKLLHLMTAADLPGLKLVKNWSTNPVDTDGIDDSFPKNGLKDGIYTNENAAALVGRSADALFISFRGTNDARYATGDSLAQDTPDKAHWWGLEGMGAHWALFQPLIAALRTYIDNPGNGITKVYVTGHSLGAAMVEALSNSWWSNSIEFVTCASPGYLPPDLGGDSRITNFWVDGDPILSASILGDNDGDFNTIFHNLKEGVTLSDGDNLHSMALYSDFMRFFAANGFDVADFRSLRGIDYDLIHAYVTVINETTGLFTIGTGANNIEGKFIYNQDLEKESFFNDFMLGGAGDDTLNGLDGRDYLVGGNDWDKLYGGGQSDYLVGGFGYDELTGGAGKDYFVFRSVNETNSQKPGDVIDLIKDFEKGILFYDTIDLAGIDARWGTAADDVFTFIRSNAFTGKSGELRFEKGATQTVVMGDCNGDGVADFSIRLDGLFNMAARYFDL